MRDAAEAMMAEACVVVQRRAAQECREMELQEIPS
jgi:hypothetical protein